MFKACKLQKSSTRSGPKSNDKTSRRERISLTLWFVTRKICTAQPTTVRVSKPQNSAFEIEDFGAKFSP